MSDAIAFARGLVVEDSASGFVGNRPQQSFTRAAYVVLGTFNPKPYHSKIMRYAVPAARDRGKNSIQSIKADSSQHAYAVHEVPDDVMRAIEEAQFPEGFDYLNKLLIKD